MSTRCNIIVRGRGESYTLYHHYDGYPEGVGAELKAICNNIQSKYYSAEDIVNNLIKGVIMKKGEIESVDWGYEITSSIHCDIEYLYILYARPYAKNGAPKYLVKGFEVMYCGDTLKYNKQIDIPELEGYNVSFKG